VQNTYFSINKLDYGAITTVGTPLGITEMRAAVNRERGDILRLLNEGMARVKASGEYDRLYRKWFVRDISPREREIMLAAAVKAAIPAYVPYGEQGRGAAVLTATGRIFSACTVENADPALSLSALHAAVSRAIAEGEFELRAAVSVDPQGKIHPLPATELQVLYEFGRGVLVLQEPDPDGPSSRMVAELLPAPVIRETGLIQTE
jgi:cytidine deaminase